MPLAEAIAMRRPVLANDLPVMREVGGRWPVYARLDSPDDIAEALEAMLARDDRDCAGRPVPDTVAEWGWPQIASQYEVIFNQALILQRLEVSAT